MLHNTVETARKCQSEKAIYSADCLRVSVLEFPGNVKVPRQVSWLERLVVRFDSAWATDGFLFVAASLPGTASRPLSYQYP